MTKVETTVGKALLAQSYSAQAQALRLIGASGRLAPGYLAGSPVRCAAAPARRQAGNDRAARRGAHATASRRSCNIAPGPLRRAGESATFPAMTMTLAELLAPMTPEQFFAEYHDRKPLHVKGGAAKFAGALSWRQVNRLLDMTHIWSSQSLKLVMDGAAVPPEQYC